MYRDNTKRYTGNPTAQPYRTVPYKSAFKPAWPGLSAGPSADAQAGRIGKKPPPEKLNPAPEGEIPLFRRDDMGHPLPPAGGSFSPTIRPGRRV